MSLAWLLNEQSAHAARTLSLSADYDFIVPANWPLEVATGLLRAERRGRISSAATAWSLLIALRIMIEPIRLTEEIAAIMSTATKFGLTAYDAAYLHLAISQNCTLATLDSALQSAATQAGIQTL